MQVTPPLIPFVILSVIEISLSEKLNKGLVILILIIYSDLALKLTFELGELIVVPRV